MSLTASDALPVIGTAIASACWGLLALLCIPLGPLSLAFAVVGVATAVASRRLLRTDPQLRGARLSLAGFILSVIALLVVALPWIVALFFGVVIGLGGTGA